MMYHTFVTVPDLSDNIDHIDFRVLQHLVKIRSGLLIAKLLLHLPDDMHIEVETNGTIAPTPALAKRVNQWNVSPKLAHAGNGAAAIVEHALAAFVETGNAWFKFVVTGEDDWAAIEALHLPQERIILMPCAASSEQLQAARLAVVDLCLAQP